MISTSGSGKLVLDFSHYILVLLVFEFHKNMIIKYVLFFCQGTFIQHSFNIHSHCGMHHSSFVFITEEYPII